MSFVHPLVFFVFKMTSSPIDYNAKYPISSEDNMIVIEIWILVTNSKQRLLIANEGKPEQPKFVVLKNLIFKGKTSVEIKYLIDPNLINETSKIQISQKTINPK